MIFAVKQISINGKGEKKGQGARKSKICQIRIKFKGTRASRGKNRLHCISLFVNCDEYK